MSSLATYTIFVINLVLNLLLVYLTINYFYKKELKLLNFPWQKNISHFNYWVYVVSVFIYAFLSKIIIQKFWWINLIIYIQIIFFALIGLSALYGGDTPTSPELVPKQAKMIALLIVIALEIFIIIFFSIFPFIF